MRVQTDVSMFKLKDLVPYADDFWQVIANQNLWDRLEWHLEDFYRMDDPAAVPELGRIKDYIRYDGQSILKSIGADLTNTIWDD